MPRHQWGIVGSADAFLSHYRDIAPFHWISIASSTCHNYVAEQLSIVRVSTRIGTTVDESRSKQYKSLFFASITHHHQNLPTRHKKWHGFPIVLTILPAGTEARCAVTIDAHCLKCISLQNAEYYVVRTYVCRPLSLSCIWPNLPPRSFPSWKGSASPPWSPTSSKSETSCDQISSPTPSHRSTWTIMVSKRSSVG